MTRGSCSQVFALWRAWAVGILSITVTAPALAQEWSVYGGVAGRVEYNDNYYFTDPKAPVVGNQVPATQESAITLSVIPFVAAARRTEVSEVTALLSAGYNKVWGISPTEDYISGSFALNGTLLDERSTWSGTASYSRSPQLQNFAIGDQVVVTLAYTDAAFLTGSYSYALTERWTVGATVGGFANRYDSVAGTEGQSNDGGYNVGANARYLLSDKTQVVSTLGFSYYTSDQTRSDVVTATIGVVHRYSPELSLSASVGGFWSDTTAKETLIGQDGPILPGESRGANGPFYGAGLSYAISERTQLEGRLSESLSGSGTGVLSKVDVASLGLTHQFSERLTGRVWGSYTRNSYPAAINNDFSDNTIVGQTGLTYQFAERWKLDAGYTYTRTTYSQNDGKPDSNVFFISVAYNWPGPSTAGWMGRPGEASVLPGAGPLQIPQGPSSNVGTTPPISPTPVPFDAFTLP